MPAAKRISKEAIIDAAAAVLRIGGFEAINARSVAEALGCSTQPIYLSFRNMEELKSGADPAGHRAAYPAGTGISAGA